MMECVVCSEVVVCEYGQRVTKDCERARWRAISFVSDPRHQRHTRFSATLMRSVCEGMDCVAYLLDGQVLHEQQRQHRESVSVDVQSHREHRMRVCPRVCF